jgi:hypothetical protein
MGQEDINKTVKEINREGNALYYLEKAAWNTTDIFIQKYPEKYKNCGGYFAYSDNGAFTCVFVQNEDLSRVILSVTFDSAFTGETMRVDTNTRILTSLETNLLVLREKTLKEITKGDVVNRYQNTSFNIIPVIDKDVRKAYILTATSQKDYMILGNDYFLEFNKRNKLKSIEPLHKSILIFKDSVGLYWTTHTHLPDYNPFMTATDVCTLLLYGDKYDHFRHHFVITKEYVSIYDYNARGFAVMKAEIFFKEFDRK